MSRATEPIKVAPGSELAHLLDDAAREPLLLEKDGVLFRLNRADADLGAEPDPEAAIAGIRAAAGSWKAIDAEAFKAYVAERRHASSRPPVDL